MGILIQRSEGKNMTNTHHTFGRLAVLTLSLALLACTVAVRAAAETPASLSMKEIKSLSATPANHERLAAYYREKAEHLTAKAKALAGGASLPPRAATNRGTERVCCSKAVEPLSLFLEAIRSGSQGRRDV